MQAQSGMGTCPVIFGVDRFDELDTFDEFDDAFVPVFNIFSKNDAFLSTRTQVPEHDGGSPTGVAHWGGGGGATLYSAA